MCLIVFPPNTDPQVKCPRCGGEAGDHPAPLAMLPDKEASVFNRPTLRQARGLS